MRKRNEEEKTNKIHSHRNNQAQITDRSHDSTAINDETLLTDRAAQIEGVMNCACNVITIIIDVSRSNIHESHCLS